MGSEIQNIENGFPQYDSPFGKDSLFNEEGYVPYINFQKLLNDMPLWNGMTVAFNYRDYQSRRVGFPYRFGLMERPYREKELTEKELEDGQTMIEQLAEGTYQRINIPYRFEGNQYAFLKGRLNIKPGLIKLDRAHVGFSFLIDGAKRKVSYQDYIFYTDKVAGDPSTEWAIMIETFHFESYLALCKAEGLYLRESTITRISEGFSHELSRYAGKANGLDWLYAVMPEFVLYNRPKTLLMDDLATLLQDDLNESGNDFINEERIVLRILEVYLIATTEEKNDFLSRLSHTFTGDKTLFELLYDKMNDWGGEDNFTRAIQLLYTIWASSEHVEPEKYNYIGQPETLAYQSRKILGFYDSDLFDFEFERNVIRVTESEQVWPEYDTGEGAYLSWEKEKAIYRYGFFQPVRLPELNQAGELIIPDTLIPAFYLKAFDDKKVWANFEKNLWLAIDIATTMTGFGNLLKLRYLLHLSKTMKIIRLAITGIEVTSGVVGTMLNLVNECTDKSFCDRLRTYLFWLDLATLSADALTQRMLRKSASDAADAMPYAVRRNNQEVWSHLDEIRVSGRGRLIGQRLGKADVMLIKSRLAEMKCDFRIYSGTKSHNIDDFYSAPGVPTTFNEGVAGMLVTDGKKICVVLRENPTIYEFLHEFMHLRHLRKIGLDKFYKLGLEGISGTVIKEQYVFDKLMTHKDFLTRDEIEHAWRYLNQSVYSRIGKLPVETKLDFSQIPEVRKLISVEEVLKIE